jgi:hypothetical protein
MKKLLLLLAALLAHRCRAHFLRTGDPETGLIAGALVMALTALCYPLHREIVAIRLAELHDLVRGEAKEEWPEEIG